MRQEIWIALYSLPSIPIAVGWWRVISADAERTSNKAILLLIPTISQLWVFGIFVNEAILGPDYSAVRYAIIAANLFGSLGVSAFSLALGLARQPRAARIATALAGLMLSVIWALTAAANSVV